MENKKKMVVALSVLLVAILLIGGVYAWLKISVASETENIVHAGKLDLILDEDASDGINMENAVPLTDKRGREQDGYTFSLVNRGTISSQYTIYLDDLNIEDGKIKMPDSIVQYVLEKDGVEIKSGLITNLGSNPNRILDTGVIDVDRTYTYNLKVWMDKDATNEYMGTVFYAQIRVEAEQTNMPAKRKVDLELTPSSIEKVPIKDGENARDFTYTSSDLDVVNVDEDGNIEVVGPGYATITKTDQMGVKEGLTVHVAVPVQATFESSDKIEMIGSIGKSSCNLTDNGQTTCKINVPEVKVKEGYEFVGWSTNQNSHEGEKSKIEISLDNKTIHPIIKIPGKTLIATFEEQGDGVESIEYKSFTCETEDTYDNEDSNASCEITLPKMNVKEGYYIVGWNTDSNATQGLKPGNTVEISKDSTYYTIYNKSGKRVTATFMLNDAKSLNGMTASELENEALEISCDLADTYNGTAESGCEIPVPEIVGSDATPIVIGFNEDVTATEPSILDTTITINEDKMYYALTKSEEKTYTATFYRNGAVSLNKEGIDFQQESCRIAPTYNGEAQDSSCSVTTPTIEPSANTPNVLGYSTSSENHECDYQAGVSIQIQENVTYYAQTSSDTVTYKATYQRGSNVESIAKEEGTCTISPSYNGAKREESCSIDAPDYVVASGYQKLGFSPEADDVRGDMVLVLEENETFYANASDRVATIEYYDNGVKVGTSFGVPGKDVSLTSAKDLKISKSGYNFQGWDSEERDIPRKVFDDAGTIGSGSLYNGEIRKIYAIWKDDIAPECTLTLPSGKYTVGDSAIATLTCIDEGSGFEVNDHTFHFPQSSSSDEFKGSDDSPVPIFNFSPNGSCQFEGNTMTCRIWAYVNCTSNGATIKFREHEVLDVAGNKSEEVVSNVVTVSGMKLTATKIGVKGVSNLGSTSESCTTKGPDRRCTVNLGEVTLEDGYRWAGWNTNKTAKKGGQQMVLTENQDFYPVVGPILADAYVYNQTAAIEENGRCVTGKEDTCASTDCYTNGGKCPIGTIFRYAVKGGQSGSHRVTSLDDYIYYFYVLHDDGDKITLQSRESIAFSKWADNIADGPVLAIAELEKETKDWEYVDMQKYEMGKKGFGDFSADTICAWNDTLKLYNCDKADKSSDYIWNERRARARMITAQEALNVGCTANNGDCPIWMYNYLNNSVAQGGTDNSTDGGSFYHIMNASSTNHSMFIYESRITHNLHTDPRSIRPVIELTKEKLAH